MLETIQIESSPDIRQCVIWLHGLGADGHDFAPIVSQLGLANTRFIFPHAPYRPVTLNHGYEMRAWFDIVGLGGNDPQDVAGMQAMSLEIQALIRTQLDAGLSSQRIALVGFSQGGAMAAYCGLAYPLPLAGLIMLSSYLPQKHALASYAHAQNSTCPIMLCHGTDDQVISIQIYHQYAQILQQAGYAIQTHEYAMGHSVCEQEISDIAQFLQAIFQAEDSPI